MSKGITGLRLGSLTLAGGGTSESVPLLELEPGQLIELEPGQFIEMPPDDDEPTP